MVLKYRPVQGHQFLHNLKVAISIQNLQHQRMTDEFANNTATDNHPKIAAKIRLCCYGATHQHME